jgi:hypothetical protein
MSQLFLEIDEDSAGGSKEEERRQEGLPPRESKRMPLVSVDKEEGGEKRKRMPHVSVDKEEGGDVSEDKEGGGKGAISNPVL